MLTSYFLRLFNIFVAMAMVVMGGMCIQKYHGHAHYYQVSVVVINCLIFVTMAMVVMGGMCVQIITTIHTTISNL